MLTSTHRRPPGVGATGPAHKAFREDPGGRLENPSLAISRGSEVVVMGGSSALKGQTIRRRFPHIWTKENDKWKWLARQTTFVHLTEKGVVVLTWMAHNRSANGGEKDSLHKFS